VAQADFMHTLEAAIQIAESEDLLLAIEPQPGNIIDSATAASQLIRGMGSSRIRVILDPLCRPAWLNEPLPNNLLLFPYIAKLIEHEGSVRGRRWFEASDLFQEIRSRSADSANSLLRQFERREAERNFAVLDQMPKDVPNKDSADWRTIVGRQSRCWQKPLQMESFQDHWSLEKRIPSPQSDGSRAIIRRKGGRRHEKGNRLDQMWNGLLAGLNLVRPQGANLFLLLANWRT
jgi:hypothetical protein